MSREHSLNSRNIVLSMLIETLEEKRLSHYVVKDTFDRLRTGNETIDKRDKDFIMTLFMGTLEKLIYLDFVINSFSNVNTVKMKPAIKNILRLSVYQLMFMDSVPERAALSEAQKLCEIRKLGGLKGFVNGVLHTVVRKKDELQVPEHIMKFVPKWLYVLVSEQYGKEKAEKFFDAVNSGEKHIYGKLNTANAEKSEILESLKNDGAEFEEITDIVNGVRLWGISSPSELETFKKGWIYFQDINSMRIAEAVKVRDPKIIVDVCASPGGKTIDMALQYPKAAVISRDINEAKINLIKDNIKRLGLLNVQTQIVDATKETPELVGKADIVIADIPCSGLGVLAKKPDIKLRVKEKDLESLVKLQREILSVVQAYVKPGGSLVFSTCTVNRGENEDNSGWFAENFDFRLNTEKQYVPGTDEGDGFYIATFIKK